MEMHIVQTAISFVFGWVFHDWHWSQYKVRKIQQHPYACGFCPGDDQPGFLRKRYPIPDSI